MADEYGVSRPRNYRASLLVILGVHLCITIPLALILNIWIDEAYSLLTTSRDFGFAMKSAREFEMQPPMFYVQLWSWRELNHSIGMARLNSVMYSFLAVWLVYLAARRWLTTVSPLWIAGPFAFNVYVLWAATEVRPYALVQVFCALLLVLFHDGFYQKPPKRVLQVLYVITAIAALYTYYFLGFMLVAMAGILLVEKRWRDLAEYVGLMILVGLLFLPEVTFVRGHVETVVAVKEAPTSMAHTVAYVGGHVFSLPFGLSPFSKVIRWGAGVSMAITIAISLFVLRDRITPKMRAMWAALLAMAVCYAGLVRFVMREDDLAERHLLIMLIPSIFAVVSVLGLFTPRARRIILPVFLALWVGFNGVASYLFFGSLAKAGDYKRVAAYLAQVQRPGDSVAVATSHAALPLAYYYPGAIYPLPEKDDYTKYVVQRWQFQSRDHAREALQPALAKDGILWLFTDRGGEAEYFGVDLNFEYLEEVLVTDYELLSEKQFYYAKVREFRKRPVSHVSEEMSNASKTPAVGTAESMNGTEKSGATPPPQKVDVFGSAPAPAGPGANGEAGGPPPHRPH